MKCFYCKKEAVGMKATDYYNTSATCFRFLCNKHWNFIETLYNNEKDDVFTNKEIESQLAKGDKQ